MRLGFGLYRHMLTEDYYQFAKQCGATDVIVHLCDYGIKDSIDEAKTNQPIGDVEGWGTADHSGLWELEEILTIREELDAHGLNFYGVENFDPAQWSDILLAGPKREAQLEQAKRQIEIFAEAEIEVFGYNFSLAGVAAREDLVTRGGAKAVGLDGSSEILETPLPNGMVWNMMVDPGAEGTQETISPDELWDRLEVFLKAIVPVAERCGITLAAHPDDPPLPMVRKQPRLVYRHHLYQKLLDIAPSPANQLEFCVGTLAEMADDDLYACIEQYASQKKVAYVHLRSVKGKVPHYTEAFIDDGDVNIERVIQIFADHNFNGVFIPDHAPQMTCDAPWHAGMAFAMGYIRSKLETVTQQKKS